MQPGVLWLAHDMLVLPSVHAGCFRTKCTLWRLACTCILRHLQQSWAPARMSGAKRNPLSQRGKEAWPPPLRRILKQAVACAQHSPQQHRQWFTVWARCSSKLPSMYSANLIWCNPVFHCLPCTPRQLCACGSGAPSLSYQDTSACLRVRGSILLALMSQGYSFETQSATPNPKPKILSLKSKTLSLKLKLWP